MPHHSHCVFSISLTILGIVGTLCSGLLGHAADVVEFEQDGVRRLVTGEVVVKAQDGGMMLRGPDDTLWILPQEEIESHETNEAPFALYGADEMAAAMKRKMGDGFSVHKTAHYVVVYNTSNAYARWVGGLYERLFRGFQSYWKGKGVKLHEPNGPLVAVVFQSRRGFEAYAKRDLGVDPGRMIGYYNVRTNHVIMYDLTGTAGANGVRINQILSQPRAERTVATIVHEATHQLAYNTGLQTRFADNPFWVSEGLAVFFEAPDLKSSKGWRGIGNVNRYNLTLFRRYGASRPADSLATLLQNDDRFPGSDAYAEAWALNYFLLRRYPREYTAYLKKLAERTPLIELSDEQRLAEFREAFGAMDAFDSQFVRYLRQLR